MQAWRREEQAGEPTAPARLVLIFNMFVDGSMCFIQRLKGVRVLPGLQWAVDLFVGETLQGDFVMTGLPADGDGAKPEGETDL